MKPGLTPQEFEDVYRRHEFATLVRLALEVSRRLTAQEAESSKDPATGKAKPPGNRRRASSTSPTLQTGYRRKLGPAQNG